MVNNVKELESQEDQLDGLEIVGGALKFELHNKIEIIKEPILEDETEKGQEIKETTYDDDLIELKIHECIKLASADTFGASDPFCIVKWNNEEIGRTSTMDNTNNPDWEDDEVFNIYSKENLIHQKISIEVWDKDDIGRGDFLGMIQFRKQGLIAACKQKPRLTYELRPMKGKNEKFNRSVQGRIMISLRRKEFVEMTDPNKAMITFQLNKAFSLASYEDSGRSHVYANIYWNNEFIKEEQPYPRRNPVRCCL